MHYLLLITSRYANDAIRAIDEVKKRQASVPKSPDSKQHVSILGDMICCGTSKEIEIFSAGQG